jgi:hypothetical protein
MIWQLYRHPPGCTPSDHPHLGRRTLVQAGGMSLLGTGLADLLRLEARAALPEVNRRPRDMSVVFI